MPYHVEMSRSALRDLRRLRDSDILRITQAVRALENEPLPNDVRKLTGKDSWRIRVGEYRVIYAISHARQHIEIQDVLRRSSRTYRNLA